MKSTKKIFVVAIAAMMLFAFTACQQMIPKVIDSVTYLDGPTELVSGTVLNPAAYTLLVNYADGSSAEINGAGAIKANATALEAGAKTVDITYGGVEGQSFVVNVYDGELEVTVPEGVSVTQAVKDGSDWQKIDAIEGLEVAIVYGPNGSKVVLESSQYSLGANTKKTSTDITEDDTVVVTVSNTSGLGGTTAKTETFTAQLLAWVDTTPVPEPEPGKGDITALRVKWTINGEDAGTENALTASVGQTVAYTIVGVAGDKEVALTTSDYRITGTIPSVALQSSDITKEGEKEAYTATVEFISTDGDDNWVAGSVAPITITLTVKDALLPTAVSNPTFTYAETVYDGSDVTLVAANFSATVKTAGGIDVKLVGTGIKDKATYTDAEITAGTPITGKISWVTSDDTYGHYEGISSFSVAVATRPAE